jgi:hypothetical protein
MHAGYFVKDETTAGELSLVPPYPLDRREVGLFERRHDLLAAERVVAGKRFILSQPAQLVEDHPAILVVPLVFSISASSPQVTGKRCDTSLVLAVVPETGSLA